MIKLMYHVVLPESDVRELPYSQVKYQMLPFSTGVRVLRKMLSTRVSRGAGNDLLRQSFDISDHS